MVIGRLTMRIGIILKNAALNNWLEGLMDNPDNVIVNNLDETKMQWAILHVTGG